MTPAAATTRLNLKITTVMTLLMQAKRELRPPETGQIDEFCAADWVLKRSDAAT
jgi:hypothetical protein